MRLRTAWLAAQATGRTVIHARTTRGELTPACAALAGCRVVRCFCKGKHIFIEFSNGQFLHNHLLMRGRWKRYPGQQLFDPQEAWLSLYLGPYTLCNLHGQQLQVMSGRQVGRQLARLGPDVMAEPYPRDEVAAALRGSRLPVTETLLRQETLCGLGNVARSEALFLAGIDPHTPSCRLARPQVDALLDAIHHVMWESHRAGGRWVHRVYHRAYQPCLKCGHTIRRIRLAPSKRNAYYCPVCQAPAGFT